MLTAAFILVIFVIGAVLMITKKLPALLALPLMGAAIAFGAWGMQFLPAGGEPGASIDLQEHVFKGVLAKGSSMLADAMLAAFFGGMLSFIMQKSGVAEKLIKNAAELIGDNTLRVAFLSMLLVGAIFTTIGGLGAIIMVAIVVLPMLATVGIPPLVAGAILLIGLSMGGALNPQNWVLYINILGLPQKDVKSFALVMVFLMTITGMVFIVVELWRARALPSLRQAMIDTTVVCGICGLAIVGIATSYGPASSPLPFFSPSFQKYWDDAASDSLTREYIETGLRIELPQPEGEDETSVSLAESGRVGDMLAEDTMERLTKLDLTKVDNLGFSSFANYDGTLKLVVRRAGEEPLEIEETFAGGTVVQFKVPVKELAVDSLTAVESLALSTAVKTAPENGDPFIELRQANYELIERKSIVMTAVQWLFGAFLILLHGAIAIDLLARVKYWRRQVVEIKWYALLIPVLPLGLIIIYSIDVNAALAYGFVYAVLATARPGTKSLTVQSMIQGSSSVLPAVLLMVGIGILVRAIIGPSGFEGNWPVIASMKPILERILPSNPLLYTIVFGIAAPLALYRGPLNLWGLGFGVAQLFLAANVVPAAAIMAMLISVGQIQGICDPTNTHNVWIANEVRVDVQALMLKTLPYIWAMAFAGLAIGSYMYF